LLRQHKILFEFGKTLKICLHPYVVLKQI